jgi:hypothetical protein
VSATMSPAELEHEINGPRPGFDSASVSTGSGEASADRRGECWKEEDPYKDRRHTADSCPSSSPQSAVACCHIERHNAADPKEWDGEHQDQHPRCAVVTGGTRLGDRDQLQEPGDNEQEERASKRCVSVHFGAPHLARIVTAAHRSRHPEACNEEERRTTVALVYGTVGEPVEMLCDAAGDPPGLRFFTVVLDDAEAPDGPSQVAVCVGCLLDEHPQLGRGLDVALEHRGAEWRDGGWVPAPELWAEEPEA